MALGFAGALRQRRGGFFGARNQIGAGGGGILPGLRGHLQRGVNRQADDAALLVNPAGRGQSLFLGGADFRQRLGALGGAVGVDRRNR